MRITVTLVAVSLAFSACDRGEVPQVVIEREPSVSALVTTVLNGGGTFRDVPFAELIEASTGKQVLPMSPDDPVDGEILSIIDEAMGKVLLRFNRDDSETYAASRINEVSAFFENALIEELDRAPEF